MDYGYGSKTNDENVKEYLKKHIGYNSEPLRDFAVMVDISWAYNSINYCACDNGVIVVEFKYIRDSSYKRVFATFMGDGIANFYGSNGDYDLIYLGFIDDHSFMSIKNKYKVFADALKEKTGAIIRYRKE